MQFVALFAAACLPRALPILIQNEVTGDVLTPFVPVAAIAINLATRPDRWTQMQLDWAAVRSVRLKRKEAIFNYRAPGDTHMINGCTASHIKVVEDAFSADPELQVLLVLEDDSVPTPHFDEVFPRVLEYAASHLEDWHIINLGTSRSMPSNHPYDRDTRVPVFQWRSPHLMRVNVWSAAHAILVNRRALPWYAWLKGEFVKYDKLVPEAFIDWMLSRQPDLMTLVTLPHLVIQRPGRSDLQESLFMDYSDVLYEAESNLRKTMDVIMQNSRWPALEFHVIETNGSWARPFYGWGDGHWSQ